MSPTEYKKTKNAIAGIICKIPVTYLGYHESRGGDYSNLDITHPYRVDAEEAAEKILARLGIIKPEPKEKKIIQVVDYKTVLIDEFIC